MADLQMCSGKDCPFKEVCYRYTAPKSEHRQAYFTNPPIKNGDCDYFWSNKKTKSK